MRGMSGSRRGLECLTLLFLCLLAGLPLGCGSSDLKFSTQYQAVFLDNGQVYFGRLDDAAAPFLTLRDVFYIRQQVSPDKKEAKNILVKRGIELHGPEFMRINSRHVVYIEPVAPDSRVAQLIREAMAGPAAAPKEPAPAPTPPATPAKPEKKGPAAR